MFIKYNETNVRGGVADPGWLGNLLKKFFQPSKCSLLGRKSNIAKSQFLKIWFFDHFWANSNYGNAKNREIRSSWSSCNLIKTFKICFDMFLVEKMKKVKKKRKMSKSLTLPRYLGFKPQLLEQNCPPKIWILKGD